MFKEIYKHLESKGLDVYSIGQHKGICNKPYIVIKENGESEVVGTNLRSDNIELLIYYPVGQYSSLEGLLNALKGYMKELPKLRRIIEASPIIIDDDKKAYMTSLYYQKIKQGK